MRAVAATWPSEVSRVMVRTEACGRPEPGAWRGCGDGWLMRSGVEPEARRDGLGSAWTLSKETYRGTCKHRHIGMNSMPCRRWMQAEVDNRDEVCASAIK